MVPLANTAPTPPLPCAGPRSTSSCPTPPISPPARSSRRTWRRRPSDSRMSTRHGSRRRSS
eukprot:7365447-Prymnesium_polylepis.1